MGCSASLAAPASTPATRDQPPSSNSLHRTSIQTADETTPLLPVTGGGLRHSESAAVPFTQMPALLTVGPQVSIDDSMVLTVGSSADPSNSGIRDDVLPRLHQNCFDASASIAANSSDSSLPSTPQGVAHPPPTLSDIFQLPAPHTRQLRETRSPSVRAQQPNVRMEIAALDVAVLDSNVDDDSDNSRSSHNDALPQTQSRNKNTSISARNRAPGKTSDSGSGGGSGSGSAARATTDDPSSALISLISYE